MGKGFWRQLVRASGFFTQSSPCRPCDFWASATGCGPEFEEVLFERTLPTKITVGVGITITHDPLHGSGRAGFPHPALALGDNAHAAQRIPGPHVPLSTLRRRPRERLRMTQGRCGSLLHIRMTLSFTTPRRFNRHTGENTMKAITKMLIALSMLIAGALLITLFVVPASVKAGDYECPGGCSTFVYSGKCYHCLINPAPAACSCTLGPPASCPGGAILCGSCGLECGVDACSDKCPGCRLPFSCPARSFSSWRKR